MVSLTATVENGSFPYDYLWERKESGSDTWSVVRDINESSSNIDNFSLKAGQAEFYIRCTVSASGKSGSQSISIQVVN